MFSETLLRMRQFVVLLPLLALGSAVQAEKVPTFYDQSFLKVGALDVLLENCSGNVPFSEEDFRRCFPPPPTFTVPPPPPFIASDGGATYSWQLVRNTIASPVDKDIDDCSEQAVQRITTPHKALSTPAPTPPPSPRPNETKQTKYNETEREEENEKSSRIEKEKKKDTRKELDNSREKVREKKRNQKTARPKSATSTSELLADITTCTDDDSDKCIKPKNESWKKGRKVRGIPGPPGPQGPPGPPGTKGNDGLPGLVVFPDAAAMFGVSIEGLIAYRKDVKQLFVRDHLTWRPIRVAKCGDGIVDRDAGEQCDDGNDDIHDDCLGCRRSSCGDGIRNRRTEECDGRDLGDKTCATYREGMTGPLTCTPVCQISYQRCRHKRYLRR